MNFLLKIYYLLPHDKKYGLISKIINRISARIIKRILDVIVPIHFEKTKHKFPTGLNTSHREKKLIVSITSFPARIKDVWIVVECLFRQTYKPDKIILWLSNEQFENFELPENLLNQQSRGLEIRFVEGDYRSHKKYLYALEEFRDEYIVTLDDDLYYDKNLIENLITIKKNNTDAVATNRAHEITFDENGNIKKYSNWNHNSVLNIPSFFLVQTGGFGTLYTKEDVDDSFNDKKLIIKLIPYADDLWMKVQTLLQSKKIATNSKYNKDPIPIKSSQIEKLVSTNVINGGNDKQLSDVLNYFQLSCLTSFKN